MAWSIESLPSNPVARGRFPAWSGILIPILGLGVCPLSVFCPVLSQADTLTLCWPHIQRGPPLCICLVHGCARVAHCVTAGCRNLSHYCRPLRQYDVWFTCFEHREALTARRQHTVYRSKRLKFATEQVVKLRYVTALEGRLKRFPWVAWFAHPWFKPSLMFRVFKENLKLAARSFASGLKSNQMLRDTKYEFCWILKLP